MAHDANPLFTGTWRLDPERSKFDALPRAKTHEVLISAHCVVVVRQELEDGSLQHFTYQGVPGGSDKPVALVGVVSTGNRIEAHEGSTIIAKKVDDHTYEYVAEESRRLVSGVAAPSSGSKPISKGKSVVSADGKEMTYFSEMVDGKSSHDVLHFQKY